MMSNGIIRVVCQAGKRKDSKKMSKLAPWPALFLRGGGTLTNSDLGLRSDFDWALNLSQELLFFL
ncbi:MAG: hypothetical protein BA861_02975 [Desulfobacterales bacterium S3730MH5]|nr:MAG: hypothetical protein BA861_02975 [Desulfobacterales bacterium S3730MH5]